MSQAKKSTMKHVKAKKAQQLVKAPKTSLLEEQVYRQQLEIDVLKREVMEMRVIRELVESKDKRIRELEEEVT